VIVHHPVGESQTPKQPRIALESHFATRYRRLTSLAAAVAGKQRFMIGHPFYVVGQS
jgi:hypothetical protein